MAIRQYKFDMQKHGREKAQAFLPLIILSAIKKEGGSKFTNRSSDIGGPTKYGISKVFNPDINVETLTLKEAYNIYVKRYVEPTRAHELPLIVAHMMLDSAIVQGQGIAPKLLQQTLGFIGKDVDGKIGKNTKKRLEDELNKDQDRFLLNYSKRIMARYATRETFKIDGHGWLSRVSTVLYECTVGDFDIWVEGQKEEEALQRMFDNGYM